MAILTPVVLYPGTAGNPDVHDILKPTDSIKALPTGAAGGILSGTYPNPSINLTNCSGTAITAGTAMATCAEMGTAISTAIAAIPAADGSETKLVAGTNTSVTGTGTTANPFVVNALPDATKADLVGGVVPVSQLPSFVDDVLEFPTLAGFPATGEAGKIYIDAATSKTYRWSGTTYVSLSSDYAVVARDEGTVLTTVMTDINFTGGGVTASNVGGTVTVNVPAGASTLPPSGAAGGILSGTYPNPSINLTNCSGTAIAAGTAMATCADLGTAIAAIPPNPTTLPPSGAAGGDLTGNYPNPSVIQASTTQAGKVELATNAETVAGTSTTLAVTPAGVKAAIDAIPPHGTNAQPFPVTSVTEHGSTVVLAQITITTAGVVSMSSFVDCTTNTWIRYGAFAQCNLSIDIAGGSVARDSALLGPGFGVAPQAPVDPGDPVDPVFAIATGARANASIAALPVTVGQVITILVQTSSTNHPLDLTITGGWALAYIK